MITNEIKLLLKEHSDEKYQKFNQKLLPGVDNILGVNMPTIRKIAKRYYNDEKIYEYIENLDSNIHEEMMIKGLLIAQGKIDNRIYYVEEYAKEISNWSICDSFCASLKQLDDSYYQLAIKFLKSHPEFHQRFGFVLILNHFINDDYINEIFELIESSKTNGYYSMMASAWLLSMIYIKYPQDTIVFLENSKQDKILINKAIQKIRESLQVDKEAKEMLKQYRR